MATIDLPLERTLDAPSTSIEYTNIPMVTENADEDVNRLRNIGQSNEVPGGEDSSEKKFQLPCWLKSLTPR